MKIDTKTQVKTGPPKKSEQGEGMQWDREKHMYGELKSGEQGVSQVKDEQEKGKDKQRNEGKDK